MHVDYAVRPLPGIRAGGCEHHRSDALLHDLTLITELRPAIKAGIVRPYVPPVCRKRAEKKAADLGLLEAAELMAQEKLGQFQVHVMGQTTEGVKIRVSGYENSVEGGALYSHLRHVPDWYPRSSVGTEARQAESRS